ncbi:beta/alpha barrel domain-containing protein [Granulicella mallensis]|uniref:Dihydroorotate oxidase n=1 Tax=Granulicella mallensis (strain ATCC BAA-1857 / DSM 23137 / MP5ACTX8) TaxID=682795 RepID=G8NQ46_GRAMM|nr:dihydroorotate oxidase [Granulicella mallensis]AEU34902.1 dihydroorotate oxidase [Granulicella mallensis MP5ACTX8]
MFSEPFYDPARSYQGNFEHGPFGLFADSSSYEQAGEPKYQFLGNAVFTPFGIPAGPLVNGAFVKASLDKGFDIPVYKTVRTHKFPSHSWPNVLPVEVEGDLTPDKSRLVTRPDYTEPLSITNSFGVPSFDPDFWQPDLASAVAHAGKGQVVVASYQGTKSENGSVASYLADFALGARLLEETGVKIIEVNLSCPNEGTAELLCFDVQRSREVVETIKNELGSVPLVVKLAYFADNARLETLIKELGPIVDGIAAINTISAEIVDKAGNQALPGEGRLRSGVCGHSIKWAGVDMAGRLAGLREKLGLKYEIVGVGGAGSAADYDEYRKAGADVVMSATAAMWNPLLAQEIKRAAHE